jgi:predicted CoA-binding protein
MLILKLRGDQMSRIDQLAEEFLAQKNIAVAGVSRKGNATANIIYKRLKETGHHVCPVNPNAENIDGVKCYPDIKSIEPKPDGVVVVTNPAVCEKVVDDCVEAGVKYVWMHNMMGHKGADKPSSSISGKAVQKCRDNNITLIPGGCPMMFCGHVDFGHKLLRGVARFTGGFRF